MNSFENYIINILPSSENTLKFSLLSKENHLNLKKYIAEINNEIKKQFNIHVNFKLNFQNSNIVIFTILNMNETDTDIIEAEIENIKNQLVNKILSLTKNVFSTEIINR